MVSTFTEKLGFSGLGVGAGACVTDASGLESAALGAGDACFSWDKEQPNPAVLIKATSTNRNVWRFLKQTHTKFSPLTLLFLTQAYQIYIWFNNSLCTIIIVKKALAILPQYLLEGCRGENSIGLPPHPSPLR
jgi:hypothetical protein